MFIPADARCHCWRDDISHWNWWSNSHIEQIDRNFTENSKAAVPTASCLLPVICHLRCLVIHCGPKTIRLHWNCLKPFCDARAETPIYMTYYWWYSLAISKFITFLLHLLSKVQESSASRRHVPGESVRIISIGDNPLTILPVFSKMNRCHFSAFHLVLQEHFGSSYLFPCILVGGI